MSKSTSSGSGSSVYDRAANVVRIASLRSNPLVLVSESTSSLCQPGQAAGAVLDDPAHQRARAD
ncbi:Uncharacterised protein [Mycobacteroides abscessus subsp. abscessus]|nr:Uncharacterised protein [Mycobacteroides abscessus subsp. abscessus]